MEGPRSRPPETTAGAPTDLTGTSGSGPRPAALSPLLLRGRSCRGRTGGISATVCLGDMGSHLSICRSGPWSCSLPRQCRGGRADPRYRRRVIRTGSSVRWQHPARGNGGPLTLTWYDGHKRPDRRRERFKEVGHLGMHVRRRQRPTLLANYDRRILLPEASSKVSRRRSTIAAVGRTPSGVDPRLRRPGRLRSAISTIPASWWRTTCWVPWRSACSRSWSGMRRAAGAGTARRPTGLFTTSTGKAGCWTANADIGQASAFDEVGSCSAIRPARAYGTASQTGVSEAAS